MLKNAELNLRKVQRRKRDEEWKLISVCDDIRKNPGTFLRWVLKVVRLFHHRPSFLPRVQGCIWQHIWVFFASQHIFSCKNSKKTLWNWKVPWMAFISCGHIKKRLHKNTFEKWPKYLLHIFKLFQSAIIFTNVKVAWFYIQRNLVFTTINLIYKFGTTGQKW